MLTHTPDTGLENPVSTRLSQRCLWCLRAKDGPTSLRRCGACKVAFFCVSDPLYTYIPF
jgi:hypothetical protein